MIGTTNSLPSSVPTDQHLTAVLDPYRMLYGVEMIMPLDLVISDVGRE